MFFTRRARREDTRRVRREKIYFRFHFFLLRMVWSWKIFIGEVWWIYCKCLSELREIKLIKVSIFYLIKKVFTHISVYSVMIVPLWVVEEECFLHGGHGGSTHGEHRERKYILDFIFFIENGLGLKNFYRWGLMNLL